MSTKVWVKNIMYLVDDEVAAEIETLQEANRTLMDACEKYQQEIKQLKAELTKLN